MKKIILSMGSLLLSSSAWADIIIKHKTKFAGQYEQDFILPLVALVILLALNTGIVLYLKRNK